MNTIQKIYISPKEGVPMHEVATANLVAGKGVEGDRYFAGQGGTFSKMLKRKTPSPSSALSITSLETLNQFKELGVDVDPISIRRNILLDSPKLETLLNKTFFLGNTVLYCGRFDYPCKVIEQYLGRSGLIEIGRNNSLWFSVRCQILLGGQIKIGDELRFPQTQEELDLINSDAVLKVVEDLKPIVSPIKPITRIGGSPLQVNDIWMDTSPDQNYDIYHWLDVNGTQTWVKV